MNAPLLLIVTSWGTDSSTITEAPLYSEQEREELLVEASSNYDSAELNRCYEEIDDLEEENEVLSGRVARLEEVVAKQVTLLTQADDLIASLADRLSRLRSILGS